MIKSIYQSPKKTYEPRPNSQTRGYINYALQVSVFTPFAKYAPNRRTRGKIQAHPPPPPDAPLT